MSTPQSQIGSRKPLPNIQVDQAESTNPEAKRNKNPQRLSTETTLVMPSALPHTKPSVVFADPIHPGNFLRHCTTSTCNPHHTRKYPTIEQQQRARATSKLASRRRIRSMHAAAEALQQLHHNGCYWKTKPQGRKPKYDNQDDRIAARRRQIAAATQRYRARRRNSPSGPASNHH